MLKRTLCILLALLMGAAALAEGYTVVDTPLFREALTDETVPLRFYDDMPSVPCLGLAEYYRMLLGSSLTVEDKGDGIYVFTTPDGAAAEVDVHAGKLASDDYLGFFNLMGMISPGMDNQYLKVPAFTRPDGLVYDDPERVTFDLGKYDIPLHAEASDVYLPLATLSDLFTNLTRVYTCWNGEKVYINADYLMEHVWQRDPDYAAPLYTRADREPDMAAFAYDELCFVIDTFYGYPGRAAINDALKALGLDGALEQTSDYTRRCRALLQSEKLGEYALGSIMLYSLMEDGGHTGFDFSEFYVESEDNAGFAADFRAAYAADPPDKSAFDASHSLETTQKILRQKRRTALGTGHYAEKGDTAVIWFDSFMYDFAGWLDYYENGGPRPEDDQMAIVIDGLERARSNPEIKNVVLDVSCNGGGTADMVMAIMSLIANESAFTGENLLIQRNITHTYKVDRNFDGVFDARDDDVHYDFHFGILTSRVSYSCGTLLPLLMKQRGMPVLGEDSGGGACAVEKHATPEGFIYQMSSALCRFVDENGVSYDQGVSVDIPLTDGGGYAGFYDIDVLSRAMNAFYGTDKEV